MEEPLSPEEAARNLLEFMTDLLRLNPDYEPGQLIHARMLAKTAGASAFGEASRIVEAVAEAYLSSPQKQAGGAILQEYFALLESEERRLLSTGAMNEGTADEIEAPAPEATAASRSYTMALVPRRDVPPLTRCIVLNKSHIPAPLSKAADAYRRRNIVVDTVLEIGMDLLWRMDGTLAERWTLEYLERHKDSLDPDLLRDLLRVLIHRDRLSSALLDWIIRWCGDMRLLENWPNVVYTGDRVLCLQAIRSWMASNQPRNHNVAHLKLLFSQNKIDDDTLLHWLEAALETLADCVRRIMAFSDEQENAEGFSGALASELRRLAGIYPLVMMAANQLLCLPNGPFVFAQAVFGLAGDGLKRWNDQLNDFASKVIKRYFMSDMRAGRSPVDTIRRLTFGDDDAFRQAVGQLDLVSQKFDSPKQRDKVVAVLVPFYASYRQDKLLAVEITRRYRKVMRMLHADFLAEVLTAEQARDISALDAVPDLASLIGDARRFLDRRRDQISSLERVMASRIDFEESTRKRRLTVIRRQLLGRQAGSQPL